MKTDTYLFQKLKQIGWANRNAWLKENPGQKFLSTYAINGALEKPKDWAAMAAKCSKNPNHQHFGKTVEEIQLLWKTKSTIGADRGNTLDDYIQAVLSETAIDTSGFDEELVAKCQQFDQLYIDKLSKLTSYVGSEIWLTSYNLGISVRLDSLFAINSVDSTSNLFIAEWKNTNNMTTTNIWNKLEGPASHLEASDVNKYTIQMHIYRYILEEYNLSTINKISSKIVNVISTSAKMYEGFNYDAKFIENIVQFTKDKLILDSNKNDTNSSSS